LLALLRDVQWGRTISPAFDRNNPAPAFLTGKNEKGLLSLAEQAPIEME
jgi:hypothetical protein